MRVWRLPRASGGEGRVSWRGAGPDPRQYWFDIARSPLAPVQYGVCVASHFSDAPKV